MGFQVIGRCRPLSKFIVVARSDINNDIAVHVAKNEHNIDREMREW